jgi:hypothetical protein
MSRGLGKIQRKILECLPRSQQDSQRKYLTVQQLKDKMSEDFTEQHIRRALRTLKVTGYVESAGDWEDSHSEPKLWRLTSDGVRARRVQVRLKHAPLSMTVVPAYPRTAHQVNE